MKTILYYTALLVLILLLSYELLTQSTNASMSMPKMISISAILIFYVVALSLIGEGKTEDERETHHRYRANRLALLSGTILLSTGILYQLFHHTFDIWLLVSLISINVVKIVSLLYLKHYK